MTGIARVVFVWPDGDGCGVVDGVLLTTVLTREGDVVALCRVFCWIVLTWLVFATFDPGTSSTTSRDGRRARVENTIPCLLDVVEEIRTDAPLGFVPVREVDRLGLVDAEFLRSMYDASSDMLPRTE
jgi:hypothetical protein